MDIDSETVREYIHPRILFDSENYYEMIDLTLPSTEPPFTRNVSLEALTALANSGEIITEPIRKVSCHSRSTERQVKHVTEMSSRFTTHDRREGAAAATLEGRE